MFFGSWVKNEPSKQRIDFSHIQETRITFCYNDQG